MCQHPATTSLGRKWTQTDTPVTWPPSNSASTIHPLASDRSSGDSEHAQYFLLELAAGIHRFIIRQASGAIFFRTLTAWNIPVAPVLQ